ncbi:flagellar hook protein FlgK [Bacillus sp. FJAT-27231]|uniref:flagellar hook-associated protein FlgK n=1 Tax=Bacillus sp. FJAT-27231 TaxID=1679168 RepID=UPI000670E2A1|nr:flagellar hook-associated protein FlgK [Bacillus sp. FJAT-27231]KMY55511.1 flagellar hook protein FlgK [Bacillus sp. FJAT-27231]
MRSTFQGLETAKRGMFTQQTAISVTGQNIANANTPGYTRQRVNFQQTEPYPAPAMNRPQIPGQMGTGVEAGSIQRVRESFLDTQYRTENNKLGYWQSKSEALSKMENILNEPSTNGLAAVMGQFWQSLQDLSVNPENEGARAVVLQRGQAVVDTFHYLSDSISAIKNDIGSQINVHVDEVNSILEQIGGINKQISEIEPHGYLPNDLYDERDRLVDQLSQLVNIKVIKNPSGGNAFKIADGTYTISLVNTNGDPVELVNGDKFNSIEPTKDNKGDITGFTVKDSSKATVANGNIDLGDFSQGRLKGLADSHEGLYPNMLNDLDKMAYTFGRIFNEVHSKGYGLEGAMSPSVSFFQGLENMDKDNYVGAASSIAMGGITTKQIAASAKALNGGNGANAINLANISTILLKGTYKLEGFSNPEVPINLDSLSAIETGGTIQSFYEGIIGKLGVDAQQALRMSKNSSVLAQSVETNRQSVSSVSLDEEMTDLIKFQHAYNAAARNITVVDEMLDKIINGMGTVGR